MQKIQECKEITMKILGTQNFEAYSKYRFLFFCEKIEVPLGVLLFNNLTKELILLSKQELYNLQESNFKEPQDLVVYLVENYFLVPESHDDLLLAEQLRTTAKFFQKKSGINSYTILTTTGCNARCFYCFEEGTPVFNMNNTTANDVANYIIKNRNPNKKVHIRWFGGEPMCNINAINVICNTLKENNILFSSDMVSNGYLFNEKIIKNAKSIWNLESVQITLDGLRETYNRIKNYINDDKLAFERVTDNIETLCKHDITVRIRLNMDTHNIDELFELTQWIRERYKNYNNIYVYARPLFEDIECNAVEHNAEERNKITDSFIKLQNHIKELGLLHVNRIEKTIRVNSCQADSDNAVLISPQGKLGRCEHHVNDDFFGSIYDDIPKQSWKDYCKPVDDCKSCVAYPSCIRLKRCHSNREQCHEYERFMRINSIHNSILYTYNEYLKKQETACKN